jgi:ABC-type phosphate transport system ATPase subunit
MRSPGVWGIHGYHSFTPPILPLTCLAFQQLDLIPQLDVMAGDLSGGQRRKLSVCISFLGEPSVVFLDVSMSVCIPYNRCERSSFCVELGHMHRLIAIC